MSADLSTSYGERVAQIRLELEQAIMAGAAAHTRVHLRRLRTVVDAATAVGVDTAGREWSTPTDGEVRARVAVVIAARIPDVLPTFPVSLLERLPEQQRRQVLEFESAWTTLPRERRAAAYLKRARLDRPGPVMESRLWSRVTGGHLSTGVPRLPGGGVARRLLRPYPLRACGSRPAHALHPRTTDAPLLDGSGHRCRHHTRVARRVDPRPGPKDRGAQDLDMRRLKIFSLITLAAQVSTE